MFILKYQFFLSPRYILVKHTEEYLSLERLVLVIFQSSPSKLNIDVIFPFKSEVL